MNPSAPSPATAESALAAASSAGARMPSRQELRRWLVRQALIILVCGSLFTAILTRSLQQPVTSMAIYCFLISLGCSSGTQGLRIAFGWGLWELCRRLGRPLRRGPFDWPGWPVMAVALLVGTALGYGGGIELGNRITGLGVSSPLESPLQRLVASLAFAMIPGLVLTVFFVAHGRIAAAEARAETLRRQAAETQLRLLESQLEPHMLFNTLANLRVLIGMDAARAQAMLDHLIAFLRATLAGSRVEKHALSEEFARLADYLALMQVRMGSRLRFEFDLPAEATDLPVPPLLLQPLVENAIKHGLEAHVGGGLLRVAARITAGELQLDVEDNGAGFDPDALPTPGGGFGTTQVRERLAVVYGPRASLRLEALPTSGTLARISIPLSS